MRLKLQAGLLAVGMCCALGLDGFAAAVAPALPRLVRPLGMGGAFTAVSDDDNALFYNPAGLALADHWHIAFPVVIDTNQKTVEFIQYLTANSSRLTGGDIAALTTTDINKLSNASAKIGVNGGLNASFRHFAFGAYAVASSRADFSMVGLLPQAKIAVNLDVIIPVGIGMKMDFMGLNNVFDTILGGGRMYIGATGKIIQRRGLTETRSIFELTSIDPASFLTKLQTPQSGFGVDVGFLYRLEGIGSSFGFSIQDIYTNIGGETVPMSMDFGYALIPKWELPIISRLMFAVDVNSITDGNISLFNKIHIGAEGTVLGLVTARGGFFQGYPSFGLGLALGIIHFDYVNHARELGKFPGQIEEREHTVSIKLGLYI